MSEQGINGRENGREKIYRENEPVSSMAVEIRKQAPKPLNGTGISKLVAVTPEKDSS